MPPLAAHITMGGSPIDFCDARRLRYSDVIAWIYADPERTRQYQVSLDARAEWLIQRVIVELQRLAVVDIREAFNPDGSLRPLASLSPELAACISSVHVDADGIQRVRFRSMTDKLRAVELLGKHLSMFIDRHDFNVHGQVQVMPTITVDNKPLRYNIGDN